MKRESKGRPACSTMNAPIPVEEVCPGCGDGIEFWSDEELTECARCGRVIRKQKES